MPRGMSPHGFAMDWPVVETDEPLSCHLCLQFALGYRKQHLELNGMLPAELREVSADASLRGAGITFLI
jgi:hypothetical protein